MDAIGKLRQYAKKKGIRVRFDRKISRRAGGFYRPIKNLIRLSHSLKNSPQILALTLAHELGHAIDFMSMSKKTWKMYMMVSGCYTFWKRGLIYLTKKRIRNLRSLIIEGEVVAWDNGEELLAELGIELPKKFVKRTREYCLQSYRDSFDEV